MLSGASPQVFLATSDPIRARQFFEGVLGFRLLSDDQFALVFDLGNGVSLRVVKGVQFTPQPFTVLGWQAPDVAATVAELTDRGVAFVRYEGMEQDERGIWSAPGGGQVAWFKDPDGNTLSISALP